MIQSSEARTQKIRDFLAYTLKNVDSRKLMNSPFQRNGRIFREQPKRFNRGQFKPSNNNPPGQGGYNCGDSNPYPSTSNWDITGVVKSLLIVL